MKLFLDTAEIGEIRIAARWGVLDGVTTNPTLFAMVGGSYDDVLREICAITPGPVSAEVVAEDVEGIPACPSCGSSRPYRGTCCCLNQLRGRP